MVSIDAMFTNLKIMFASIEVTYTQQKHSVANQKTFSCQKGEGKYNVHSLKCLPVENYKNSFIDIIKVSDAYSQLATPSVYIKEQTTSFYGL